MWTGLRRVQIYRDYGISFPPNPWHSFGSEGTALIYETKSIFKKKKKKKALVMIVLINSQLNHLTTERSGSSLVKNRHCSGVGMCERS